jgi:D-proline reductase (dithiol) PrdB
MEALMVVDSFKFLPRVLAAFYQMTDQEPELPIPWTPLSTPVPECKFGLITSGGLYHKDHEPPFNLEREREEPTWGDPTYRSIPVDFQGDKVAASHLHLNTRDMIADLNILLPIHRFQELTLEGHIGGLASCAYSFMGYQGFPPNTEAWETIYGPQVAGKFNAEGVRCVLLTPA